MDFAPCCRQLEISWRKVEGTSFDSVQKAVAFGQTVNRLDVLDQLHDVTQQQGLRNIEKLKSILSCIEFCGRQNIALRGHRNEDWDPASEDPPKGNPGNFLALLRMRHVAGDSFSKQHMFAKKGLSAVPAVFVKDPAGSKACLLELAKEYEEDLPADQDLSTLSSEINAWRH